MKGNIDMEFASGKECSSTAEKVNAMEQKYFSHGTDIFQDGKIRPHAS